MQSLKMQLLFISFLLISGISTYHQNTMSTARKNQILGEILWSKEFSTGIYTCLIDNYDSDPTKVIVPTLSPLITAFNSLTGNIIWKNATVYPLDRQMVQVGIVLADVNANGCKEVLTCGMMVDPMLNTTEKGIGLLQGFDSDTGNKLWQKTSGLYIKYLSLQKCDTTYPNIITSEHRWLEFNYSICDTIRVFNGSSLVEVWNRTYIQPMFVGTLETSDLTGDGFDECIVSICTMVTGVDVTFVEVYDGQSHNLLWNSTTINDWIWSLSVDKLSADAVPDVLCTSMSDGIYALNGANGSLLWSVPNHGGDNSRVADINADGIPEVISATETFLPDFTDVTEFVIINGRTGSIIGGYNTTFDLYCVDLQVVDLDGDHVYEIVAASFYNDVYIFTTTGTLLSSFTTSGPAFTVLTCDVDHSGTLEIIAGTLANQGHLYVYQYAKFPPKSSDLLGQLGIPFLVTGGLIISGLGIYWFIHGYKRKQR